MIWLVTRLVVWPAKVSALSAKAGFRAGRLVGFRRLSLLGLGVGVGLLVAPVPGRELRAKLRERLEPAGPLLALPAGGRGPLPVLPADEIDLTRGDAG